MIEMREQVPTTSVASALNGMRVLVIEDIWIVAQSYVALLDSLGVVVSGPASTVAEAMNMIESASVDAALVDMNLHGEMAYGVVEALNGRGIPVLVVTGYEVVPELEHKVHTFLKKPIRAEALIKAMRSVAAAT
jgi:CheY-like chemotaxis protein